MKKTTQSIYNTKDHSGAFAQVSVFHIGALLRTGGKETARAFTLIETFVAITVLLISLVGPLSIAAQSLRLAYYARDQVTAFYLAQEAVEYVRAQRDQNYLANASWLTNLGDCVGTSCVVDFPRFTHSACGVLSTCPPIYISSATKLYNQDATSGPASAFTRVLSITPVAGSVDEVIVKVRISWVSVGISRSFQVTEHLFNWAGP